MHKTSEPFEIYCVRCNEQTLARKHARQRIARPMKWCGVNCCLQCGELYDSFLPSDFDHGERRPSLPGMAP